MAGLATVFLFMGVLFGKIDGPGSWLNHQVHQESPNLFFNQINQRTFLLLHTQAQVGGNGHHHGEGQEAAPRRHEAVFGVVVVQNVGAGPEDIWFLRGPNLNHHSKPPTRGSLNTWFYRQWGQENLILGPPVERFE